MAQSMWVIPFPQMMDFREIDESEQEYWETWRDIREVFNGGACAAEHEKGKDAQRVLIVRLLSKILSRSKWKSDQYAINFLACCFAEGWGVSQDMDKARQGFLDAANLSLKEACFNLGVLLASGRNGKSDYFRAVQFFKKGKKLGCPLCGNRLDALGKK